MLMSVDKVIERWPTGMVEVLYVRFGVELRGKPV